MDFAFTPDQESLRRDVRAFLDANLPPEREEHQLTEWGTDEEYEFGIYFSKQLAKRGWLTAHWPQEFGGLGLSIMDQVVLREELAYRRAPLVNPNGLNMLAPILMLYGTKEQQERHLPGIASCDVIWCQGYSEPNAGSDLASLQTRAVRDGDEYIINGQKIWTGAGHRAQWMFLLARTNPDAPKHRGISFFLLDMSSPGVTVQPLRGLSGSVIFCQEFLENVRVPKDNLVGEENQGWYIGTTLLNFERSNISTAASTRRTLDDLIAYCRENGILRCKPYVGAQLADLVIAAEVGRLLSYRVACLQDRGVVPTHEASAAKLYHSELSVRVAEAGYALLGLAGQLRPEERDRAPLSGHFALSVLLNPIGTVGGGTSEIQRNIIATRGLGLPRG